MIYTCKMISRIWISLSGLRNETLKPKKVTVFTRMFEREQRRVHFERLTSPLKGIAVWGVPIGVDHIFFKDIFSLKMEGWLWTVQENSLSHQIERMYRPAQGVISGGPMPMSGWKKLLWDHEGRSTCQTHASCVRRHPKSEFKCARHCPFLCFGIGTSCVHLVNCWTTTHTIQVHVHTTLINWKAGLQEAETGLAFP